MKGYWGNTDKHRKSFNILVWVVTIVALGSIVGSVLYFNWNSMLAYFKDKFSRKETEVYYEDPRELISLDADDFDELLIRVEKLEELSKKYDSNNYKLRTMIYIRSVAYNDAEWSAIGGSVDSKFLSYVKKNEGNYDLIGLKYIKEITIPSTGDKVDFCHMFAAMNVVFKGQQNAADLSGWAGDLCQLINEFKSTTKTGNELLETIRSAFNKNSSFGSADVCADFDAVNLVKLIKSQANASISNCMQSYYNTLTNKERIQQFKSTTFPANHSTVLALQSDIMSRLTSNSYIILLARKNGIDFAANSNVINACVQVFAEYIYPTN